MLIPRVGGGGVSRYVFSLTRGLIEQGHKVTVFCAHPVSQNAATHSVQVHSSRGLIWAQWHYLQAIRKQKPDVVHAHKAAFVAAWLSVIMFRNIRFYYTIHSEPARDAAGIRYILNKLLLRLPNVQFIALSPRLANMAKAYYRTNKVVPILTGI